MVIAVEGDATTPTDHAVALYEALRGPRRLVMQRHTTHYAAYDRYWDIVTPRIVEWYERYLVNGGVVVREQHDGPEIRHYHDGTSDAPVRGYERNRPMKFGLLLPHFGEHADRDKLLDGSKLAEELGFDSVWVRDHLVFEPHGEMEKPNNATSSRR